MPAWFDIASPYHQLYFFLAVTLLVLLLTKINTGFTIGLGYFILLCWMMIAPIVWASHDWGWWYLLHLVLAITVYYLCWIANIILHEKLNRELGMGSGDVALLGVPLIFAFFIALGIALKLLVLLLSYLLSFF